MSDVINLGSRWRICWVTSSNHSQPPPSGEQCHQISNTWWVRSSIWGLERWFAESPHQILVSHLHLVSSVIKVEWFGEWCHQSWVQREDLLSHLIKIQSATSFGEQGHQSRNTWWVRSPIWSPEGGFVELPHQNLVSHLYLVSNIIKLGTLGEWGHQSGVQREDLLSHLIKF